MPNNTIFIALITFLHDLFTAIWIGGLITLGLTVMPSAKKLFGKGPETKKLMDAIQKRHSVWVYVSIAGLILTGILQSRGNPAFLGPFSFGNAYSSVLAIKHIMVIAMVAIALYRSLILGRAGGEPAKAKLKAALLLLNIILGVAILLASGFNAALA